MNNRDQETQVWRSPLIFTMPAYGFVMALYLDWLGQSDQVVSAKIRRWPTTAKAFAGKVRNEAEESDERTKRLAGIDVLLTRSLFPMIFCAGSFGAFL